MAVTQATGWLCICGRSNVSSSCPRCGAKRPADAPSTPANALPRSTAYAPGCETPSRSSPRPRRTATLERREEPPAPVRFDWTDDLVYAISKPLTGATPLLVVAVGALLSIVSGLIGPGLGTLNAPLVTIGIIALGAYIGLYYNYFIRTIQTASQGREELPDSPSGYEAIGLGHLLWIILWMHVGLFLPLVFVGLGVLLVPSLAAYTLQLVVAGLVYPIFAYPMTVLLTAQTLNAFAAFNYPAILASIVSTFGSYLLVLAFFMGLELAPGLARAFLFKGQELSLAAQCALNAASAAWTMYAMIALGLFLGRFFYREKERLGWFR
jgi:hypothetical protein